MRASETSSTGGRVLLDYDGSIAFVTLSHPGRLNSITVFMWQELQRIFTQLSANQALRCVVLRGEGGNFAAGADIREFPTQRADLAGVQHYHTRVLAPALSAIASCIHPVLAQLHEIGRPSCRERGGKDG